MNTILAADIEAMQNAEATAAKTIEEEMLGTDAEGAEMSEDPVNLSTGNFVYDHEDLKIDGEIPLSFHRYYNSKDSRIGTLGKCFLHNYEISLEENQDGNLTQTVNALKRRVNMTYDAEDRLLNISINGKERLKNSYDANGNLLGTETIQGNGIRIVNNSEGRPTEIMYADGSKVILVYDEKGNVVQYKDGFGGITEYEYDALNRIVCTRDANENRMTYQYDDADRIICVQNAEGNSREYTYNASGQVTGLKDYDGNKVQLRYNNIGKIQEYIDKEGYISCFAYDKMWNMAQQTNPDGGVQRYIYNADNRLEREVLPMGGEIIYTYDAVGNRTSITDAEGNITAFAYDAANHMIAATESNGTVTTYQYDREGNLIKVIDALKHETTYTYDDMGKRTSVTDTLGNTTSVYYDRMGNVERVCYPNGSERVYSYEAGGRLKSVSNPDGSGENYAYDKEGNLIAQTNAAGETIRMTYDCMNRVCSITNPMGGVRYFSYNALGAVTKLTDENGNVTCYEYSPNGNLIKVTDALGNESRYEYDMMGNLIKSSLSGTAGEIPQETMYSWNLAGQVASITDPLGLQETYAYDKKGNMISKKDKDGYVTNIRYNAAGEMEEIMYADGRKVYMSYNALKQLTEMKDWLGNTNIQLDAMGRPLAITDANGETVGYEWGAMGEKLALTYPDGKRAVYEYNQAMQLIALHTGNETIRYAYDEAGRLKEKILPEGITTSYNYDVSGMLSEITHEGAQVLEKYQYCYDAIGNKIGVTKNRQGLEADQGTFCYQYDKLSRIAEVVKDGKTLRSYTYDAFGNRIQKKDYMLEQPQTTVYQYNAKNQLISEADALLEKQYNYDHRGNLIAVRSGEKQFIEYSYDVTDQLSGVTEIIEGVRKQATYKYNGLGHRVEQLLPEKKIRYTLDLTRQYHNLLQIGVEGEKRTEKQRFYWDTNVIAMGSANENGEESFFLQDDIGSPMKLIDATGDIRESYAYDEFGVNINVIGTSLGTQLQPFGYTGYQREEIGGLYFAQARRYDADAGRFVSEDLLKGFMELPFTQNHYVYCWNKPLDYVDWNGMCPEGKQNKKQVYDTVMDVIDKAGDVTGFVKEGIDDRQSINMLLHGAYFKYNPIGNKNYIQLSGSIIENSMPNKWKNLENFVETYVSNKDWNKSNVKKLVNKGLAPYDDLLKDLKFKDLDDYLLKLNSSGGSIGGVVRKSAKEGFPETFKFWNDFKPSEYKDIGKLGKIGKALGAVGTILSVADSAGENLFEDGEFKPTADGVQDTITDFAVDLTFDSVTTAAGGAIGSLFLPPIGTVVGAAAGMALGAALEIDIIDVDKDGEKDSVIDMVKIGVDTLCDKVGDAIGGAVK